MSAEALAGMALFQGKANCAACHSGPDFTDGDFHNTGTGMQRRVLDLGRHDVTKQDKDRGAFKTPTLRNLSDTFPYMHDGSLETLNDVIDFFDKGGLQNTSLSPKMKPLAMTALEKKHLLAFLQSLEGDKVIVKEPRRYPQ